MTEISHLKAQALLQAASDASLAQIDQFTLDAHLAGCKECTAYANSLAGLETALRKTLHAQWDHHRPALDLKAIQHPAPVKMVWNSFFGHETILGKFTVMAVLLLGYFVLANLAVIRIPPEDKEVPPLLPTPYNDIIAYTASPTPSIQSALTNSTSTACRTTVYVVRKGDMLESIALQHGITIDELLEYNLENRERLANRLYAGFNLVVPYCEGTPAHTLSITPIHATILPEQPE